MREGGPRQLGDEPGGDSDLEGFQSIPDSNALVHSLLDWYETSGDRYPFRETYDPYRILVCEILLRKTRAAQVAGIYNELFTRFPTIQSMATASNDELLRIIRPLGIHSRADDLILASREICIRFQGEIPSKPDDLMKIRGIGRYIAGAVLIHGFDSCFPAVDSNIMRVLSRISGFRLEAKSSPPKEMLDLFNWMAPRDDPRSFHFALIDLAHKICRPKMPSCDTCPVSQGCRYRISSQVDP